MTWACPGVHSLPCCPGDEPLAKVTGTCASCTPFSSFWLFKSLLATPGPHSLSPSAQDRRCGVCLQVAGCCNSIDKTGCSADCRAPSAG